MEGSVKIIVSILFFTLSFLSFSKPGNLHQIDDEIYRSGQLRPGLLSEAITRYNLQTVINLRGHSPGKKWYDKEKRIVEEHGLNFYSIGMSAGRLPHRKDILKLIDLFENAPRPILFHCQGGADRSGEASAMYLIDFMGKSKKEALKMLRIKYGHLRWRYPAKRYFIKEIYQGKEWAKDHYRPCESNYKYYDKSRDCKGLKGL